jgi:hypothetical protein
MIYQFFYRKLHSQSNNFLYLDLPLVKLSEQIEVRKTVERPNTRQIRKEINSLNKELLRQKRGDGNQRKEMMNLINQLKQNSETDPEYRIIKAKKFMTQREHLLQENGLLWAVTPDNNDISHKLSIEYQVCLLKLASKLEICRKRLWTQRVCDSLGLLFIDLFNRM